MCTMSECEKRNGVIGYINNNFSRFDEEKRNGWQAKTGTENRIQRSGEKNAPVSIKAHPAEQKYEGAPYL